MALHSAIRRSAFARPRKRAFACQPLEGRGEGWRDEDVPRRWRATNPRAHSRDRGSQRKERSQTIPEAFADPCLDPFRERLRVNGSVEHLESMGGVVSEI